MPIDVGLALELCLGSPFAVSRGLWQQAVDALTLGDPGPQVVGRLKQGDAGSAERVWLALGHAQACRWPSAPTKVLPERSAAARGSRRLPRRRSAYLRVVMAAGRCYQALSELHGQSEALEAVKRKTWSACFGESLVHALSLERVVRDHDVLVMGETGSGKDPIARAIQAGTAGPEEGDPAPSGVLNAAAVPDALIESELFGHVRGAFTGAARDRVGRLRKADGGCFFLDEVGDLPLTAQVKLLRVMETDFVDPVGADEGYQADIRYVAASHKDLAQMVDEGSFRRDLYQRLAGNVIRIPPLRERPEDIVDIGMGFARRYLEKGSPELERIESWLRSRSVLHYAWPGNVRELQNALRNVLLGLQPALSDDSAKNDPVPERAAELPSRIAERAASLKECTDWYLRAVLERVGFNYAEAARILKLDRTTVRRRARDLRHGED